MFDQVVDNFRKATDSTIQFQQEMFRQWAQQWSQLPGVPTPGSMIASNWAEQVNAFQRRMSETVTDLLNKHREALDTQYRSGIRTIEDAFRVAQAKDPAQFRRLTEELLRQSFECLKTAVETQTREFQAATEKALAAVSQGMTTGKM